MPECICSDRLCAVLCCDGSRVIIGDINYYHKSCQLKQNEKISRLFAFEGFYDLLPDAENYLFFNGFCLFIFLLALFVQSMSLKLEIFESRAGER